jgi:hypothetical protein
MQNKMAAAWSLRLIFGFMVINYEPLELDTRNLVRKQVTIIPTSYVWNFVHKSAIINMATVRNFHVMSDKFNADKVCIYVINPSQKENNNNYNNNNMSLELQAVENTDSTRIRSYDPTLTGTRA